MIHTNEKRFSCRHCQKLFRHLESLKRHERTHTGEKPFPCNHCEKSFRDQTALKKHIQIHKHNEKTLDDQKPVLDETLFKMSFGANYSNKK